MVTFGDVADRASGTLPSQSALLGSKALDLCNPNDPICHAGPGNEWSGYTEGYVPGLHHPGDLRRVQTARQRPVRYPAPGLRSRARNPTPCCRIRSHRAR
ncbi:alpha/beta hydrolase family protein [Mycobacterium tilburgii]|uniref:hypothetical protein n=1 Tax=Mycobacterium tilburgii TaxID=44467 RepID=UPI0028C448B0|nr:hypothetical protein [Mycobacterium tilburgii]